MATTKRCAQRGINSTLAEKLSEAEADKSDHTLGDKWTEAVIILGGTMGNVESKAIIDEMASTLPGVEEETIEEITLQCGG